jgi:hypothetical protein
MNSSRILLSYCTVAVAVVVIGAGREGLMN